MSESVLLLNLLAKSLITVKEALVDRII
jgi:hypothetical protein